MDQLDFKKLWQNFTDTVSKHYIDFDGRVGRPQFWYYVLVYFVVLVGVAVVGSIIGSRRGLVSLYELALLAPGLGIMARRLHDTGKTASWVLLLAIPGILSIFLGIVGLATMFFFPLLWLLGGIALLVFLVSLAAAAVLIYFCVQPGTSGPNEYGPLPPEWTPYRPPAAPVAPPPTAAA